MGAKRTTTIGYERRYNSALQVKDKDTFIESLTTNMPAAPDHFSRCSAINGKGPILTRQLPALEQLNPDTFRKAAAKNNAIIVDIRSYEAFGGQHVPGSYHIDFGGNFATFAGWVLPPNKDILIVAQSSEQAQQANTWLRRVGLDRTKGYLEGGMFVWAKAGLPTGHVIQLCAEELHRMMRTTDSVCVVDVRAVREYEAVHITGAVNIPAPELRTRYRQLDKRKPTVLVCSTGHRSSLAASLLKRVGFTSVFNVAGGMTGYGAAGYAAECPMCVAPHVPAFMGGKKV